MQSHHRTGLVSEAEYLALPETQDRIELIDGEVILGPSPTPRHQVVVSRLCRILGDWADAHPPAFLGLSPLDVRIAPARIVQPDLFVVFGGIEETDGPIDTIPELIVEVVSKNRGYDRVTKRFLYAEAGVAEYWIVDPLQERVELCHGLDDIVVCTDGVTSTVATGLRVDVHGLLA